MTHGGQGAQCPHTVCPAHTQLRSPARTRTMCLHRHDFPEAWVFNMESLQYSFVVVLVLCEPNEHICGFGLVHRGQASAHSGLAAVLEEPQAEEGDFNGSQNITTVSPRARERFTWQDIFKKGQWEKNKNKTEFPILWETNKELRLPPPLPIKAGVSSSPTANGTARHGVPPGMHTAPEVSSESEHALRHNVQHTAMQGEDHTSSSTGEPQLR